MPLSAVGDPTSGPPKPTADSEQDEPLLPFQHERGPGKQEDFRVEIKIIQSKIPGAGRGCIVTEKVRRHQVLTEMRTYRPADAEAGSLAAGTVVRIDDLATLQSLVANPSSVANRIADFAFASFASGNVDNPTAIFIRTMPAFVNHADEANVALFGSADGLWTFEVALRDIEAGEELYQDYRFFAMPAWFNRWCDEHEVTTAQKLGVAVSDPQSAPKSKARHDAALHELRAIVEPVWSGADG